MASVARRPDGRWRARYRDEEGREHARHFGRRADAQRWLDEVTAAVVRGDYVDPRAGRVTFAAFYAAWSDRQVWAPGTRRAVDLAAGSVTFGDVPLRALRRSHVERWVKGMVVGGLAATTVHTRVGNVRAVLRGAVADRVIPRDPSEGVVLPRRRRLEAAMTVPGSEEVGALLQAAPGPFRALLGLCAFAGLRLGEAAAVQLGDVDWLRRSLAVTRQVQRVPGGVEVRPPKHGSERTVHLAPGLLDLLAVHVERHRTQDGPWLFDGPPHQNTVGHLWRRTVRDAGVRPMRLHDLRHYFASGLVAAGCDVVTVQRALGHASATTTLGTYGHLWPSAEDRTREAAQAMLVDALGAAADSLRTGGR